MAILAVLPDLPVIGPAVAPRAYAQSEVIVTDTGLRLNPHGPLDIQPPDPPITVIDPCRPIGGQIIQQFCSYVNPPESLTPFISAIPPYAALQLFESDTVKTYLKSRYMSPDDAPLFYQYGGLDMRSEVRSLMMNRIRKMSADGPANALERAVYDWFKYQLWLFERTMYEVAVAERNAWQSNPCGWRPDPDLASAYGLEYDPKKFCNSGNSLKGLLGDPPIVPTKAYFLGAAQKKVYGKAVEASGANGPLALAKAFLTEGPSAAISAMIGGGLGAGVGAGASKIWIESIGRIDKGAKNVKKPNVGLMKRIGGGGAAIVLSLMIESGIRMGFRVFEYEAAMNDLKTLDGELAAIKQGPYELSRYSGSMSTGGFKMTKAFASTTLPDVPGTAPLPSHDPLTDPGFYLTPSNTYSATLTYQDELGSTFSAKTYKGWFIIQCLTKCEGLPATSVTPSLDIVDSAGNAWTASRLGSAFAVVKQVVETDDVLCQQLSTAADPGKCASYITPSVPYLNAAGVAGTFSLVSKPFFTSPSTFSFTQGVARSVTVTATGAPAPTITASPIVGFTFTPGIGSATLRYDGSTSVAPGTYTIQLAATNESSTTQTVTVTVNGAAPTFTSSPVARFIKGVPGSVTVQATGNPAPALTPAPSNFLPPGLTFVDNGDGTATISGTVPLNSPSCACSGLINATVFGAQTQQSLTINVQDPFLPTLQPASLVFTAGLESEGKIVATGPTLGKLAVVCTSLPSWLTFKDNGNNTATVRGNPPPAAPWVAMKIIVAPPGVPVTYSCSPGGESPNYTVGVRTMPVFTSPPKMTFIAGLSWAFVVSGSYADTIAVRGDLPPGVSFTRIGLTASALLTGTPPLQSGGVYPLVFTIGSGVNTATQDFTLTVKEGPFFVGPSAATFTVNQPGALSLPVLGFPQMPKRDEPGMQMSIVTGALPPGMKLVEKLSSWGEQTGSWMLTGAPTATGRYTAVVGADNGLGFGRSQAFTIDVVPVPVPKASPIITWPLPAAVTYGSALSATQLNATTTVPGTFLYEPPAGTVLPVGSHTLSVTFAPTDSEQYNTVTATNNITINPAPAGTVGKPTLVITNTLTRLPFQGGSVIVATVRVANTGNAPATDVTLTSLKVGSNLGIPAPQYLGTLPPGTSLQTTFQAPAPGAPGAASSLSITGTYTGGTISSNARIVLP